MKNFFKTGSFLFLILVGVYLLVSCEYSVNVGNVYPDADKYSVGGAEISADINKVDISWLTGKAEIKYHSSDKIIIAEDSGKEISEQNKLRYLVDGDVLKIQFAESGIVKFGNLQKTLTVTLPETLVLSELKIDTASADVSFDNARADKVKINSASGKVNAAFDGRPEDLSFDTASGEINVRAENVVALKADSSSGSVTLDVKNADTLSIDTSSGKVNIKAEKIGKADIKSASGSVTLELENAPNDLEIDTASGNVSLLLPENSGFTLDYDTASGEFTYDIPIVKQGGKYVSGDGKADFEIDTASGDLKINKNS